MAFVYDRCCLDPQRLIFVENRVKNFNFIRNMYVRLCTEILLILLTTTTMMMVTVVETQRSRGPAIDAVVLVLDHPNAHGSAEQVDTMSVTARLLVTTEPRTASSTAHAHQQSVL